MRTTTRMGAVVIDGGGDKAFGLMQLNVQVKTRIVTLT